LATFTSQASWAWLTKILCEVRFISDTSEPGFDSDSGTDWSELVETAMFHPGDATDYDGYNFSCSGFVVA